MRIHVPTLFFAGALITGMFTMVMATTLRVRTTYPGFGKWVTMLACLTAQFSLQSVRGTIGELWPVAAGNLLTSAAFILLASGIYEFAGRRMHRAPVYILAAAYVAGIYYFYFFDANIRARTVLLSTYMAVMLVYAARPLLGKVPEGRRFGYRFAAATLLMGAANGAFHAMDAVRMADRQTLYSGRPTDLAFYIITLTLVIGVIFSFFLLTNERAAADLVESNKSLVFEVAERQRAEKTLLAEMSTRKRLETQLNALINSDELTGVMNRRGMMETLQNEVRRAHRFNHPLAVLALDLDNFKHINDTYGHAGGDSALKHIGEICRKTLRLVDIVGRPGGDEFLVILPMTSAVYAMTVGEKLRAAITGSEVHWANESFRVTVSIGIGGWQAGDETGSKMIEAADAALYRAKQDGRNCVR